MQCTVTPAPGFTLVELVITLVMTAILASMAVSAFRSTLQNNRLAVQANQFITAVNLARSEALKRGTTVRLAAISGSDSADEWGSGFRVWVDRDSDNTYDSGEEIREFSPLGGKATLDSVDNLTVFGFLPNGLANISASTVFKLRIPNCTAQQSRDITVTVTGRVSASKLTGSCT